MSEQQKTVQLKAQQIMAQMRKVNDGKNKISKYNSCV